jgi:hypothetical protein
MPTYLVERYLPAAAAPAEEAASAAPAEPGSTVRHVHTTFVPEDEVCFHVFEAPSREALTAALHRAAIAYERVVEAVDAPQGKKKEEESR